MLLFAFALSLLTGVVFGVALAGGRALAHQLFGVKSYDPMALGGAVAVLAISAVVAGLPPSVAGGVD